MRATNGACSSLTSITIPNSVTSIGDFAFDYCEKLTDATNLATTPQSIDQTTFSAYGTLHVLPGCGDSYRAAEYWKRFTIIEDAEIQTEVENILSVESKSKGVIYDINGRKVQNVVPGYIYIQDGKKILMK